MMYTTIETKGFKAGKGLREFLSCQLQSLAESYNSLNSAALKLSFTDDYFYCDLTLNMANQPFYVSLCKKNFYEAVLNTIDLAENALKNRHVEVSIIRKKAGSGRYILHKRMMFQFSEN